MSAGGDVRVSDGMRGTGSDRCTSGCTDDRVSTGTEGRVYDVAVRAGEVCIGIHCTRTDHGCDIFVTDHSLKQSLCVDAVQEVVGMVDVVTRIIGEQTLLIIYSL